MGGLVQHVLRQRTWPLAILLAAAAASVASLSLAVLYVRGPRRRSP